MKTVFAILAILIAIPNASAQFSGTNVQPKAPTPVRTFSAGHADPTNMAKILGEQFDLYKFSADPATKTIFARIDGDDAEAVEKFIERVSERAQVLKAEEEARQRALKREALEAAQTFNDDRPAPRLQLRSFDVKHLPANQVHSVLQQLRFEDNDTNVTVVGQNLLARSTAEKLEELGQVLELIDVAPIEEEIAVAEGTYREIQPQRVAVGQRLNEADRRRELLRLQQEREVMERLAAQRSSEARQFAEAMRLLNGKEREQMRPGLKESVTAQFESRLEQQRLQLHRLEMELKQVRDNLSMQERLKDQIIEKRMAELLNAKKADEAVSTPELRQNENEAAFAKQKVRLLEKTLQSKKERNTHNLKEHGRALFTEEDLRNLELQLLDSKMALERIAEGQSATSKEQQNMLLERQALIRALQSETARKGALLQQREAELRQHVDQRSGELRKQVPQTTEAADEGGADAVEEATEDAVEEATSSDEEDASEESSGVR